MDVLLGITTGEQVIIATSKAAMRGISVLKNDDDKTRNLNKHSLIAFSGESGDTGNSSLHLSLHQFFAN